MSLTRSSSDAFSVSQKARRMFFLFARIEMYFAETQSRRMCKMAQNQKIFVGNLAWGATEEGLRAVFEEFGEVVSVRIVNDPYTGRSKGFGFVEMKDEGETNQAIEKLDNANFLGRPLRVGRARQENRTPGSRPPRGGQRSGGAYGRGGQEGSSRGSSRAYEESEVY
jgi:RNA recognition motif-containing protein